MDENKRHLLQGWVDKASNHLEEAKQAAEFSHRISDSIQASQQCVELSVKTALTVLNIDFPQSHGWSRKDLSELAKQIQERGLLQRLQEQHLHYQVRLPRLLFRVNFWSHFYIEAKYGFEASHLAPAQDLFEKEDAELAVHHAKECLWAAKELVRLSDEKLAALL